MNRTISLIPAFCAMLPALAQTSSQNYVLVRRALTPSNTSAIETLTYIDGLGRPVETVQKGASPDGNDIVTMVEYEGLDRELRSWLPVAVGSGGAFVSPDAFKTAALHSPAYSSDDYPYTENVYESSPLGRVVIKHGPGRAWRAAGRHTATEYLVNRATGVQSCMDYRVTDDNRMQCMGVRPAGTLRVIKTTDEDGHSVYDFADMFGNTVLVRRILNGKSVDTNYVFDDFHQLRYVLPPSASAELGVKGVWGMDGSTVLQDYAYYYLRDGFGRILEKKLPGAEKILYVNDAMGNPVFSQNGVQRAGSQWSFQLYDSLQRPTVSGIIVLDGTPDSPLVCTSSFTGNSGRMNGYAPYAGFPAASKTAVTRVRYYDGYDFLGVLTQSERNALAYEPVSLPYHGAYTYNGVLQAKGMQTGDIVYALNSGSREATALYNDVCGRVVQSRKLDINGNTDSEYTAYSFTGKPVHRKHVYTADSTAMTEEYTYAYDHADRLTDTRLSLNGGKARLLSSISYDGIGRPQSTTLGNGTRVSMCYNVRSWLTSIDSPYFSETLSYERPGSNGVPCYGGNVSQIDWRATDGSRTLNQSFHNRYDALDRLVSVDYAKDGTMYKSFVSYSYDLMGNLLTLRRKGRIDGGAIDMVDDLTYSYSGNQLKSVTDWSPNSVTFKDAMHFTDAVSLDTEYEYDANGNMTRDRNKGIGNIVYNTLDLPYRVNFLHGLFSMQMVNTYLADGTRVRTEYRISGTGPSRSNGSTQYCGNHIYENGKLSMTLFDGGFISYANGKVSSPSFHYYIKDHLGSNRIVLSEANTVEQVNDYYPFGALMSNGWTGTSTQKYKYVGKELDRSFGLDMYDYGARWNDAVIGRWPTMDKLAEKAYDVSPYAFCFNNPFKYMDLDGNAPGDFFKTMDDAAIDFGMYYNAKSIRDKQEYGSSIYVVWDENKGKGYSYSVANVGVSGKSVNVSTPFNYNRIVGDVHTHGSFSFGVYYDNDFSGSLKEGEQMTPKELKEQTNTLFDIGQANEQHIISYLVSPCGYLQKYDSKTGKITTVSTNMPSDENDPLRVNFNVITKIGKDDFKDTNFINFKNK